MKKVYAKKLLSLIMVVLLVFPALVFASSQSIGIKSVCFEDDDENMVFVDYEEAIENNLEGDSILYDAIRDYVGSAEEKGRSVYLETNDGEVLDYSLAMMDSNFKLKDIIGNEKYEYDEEIECTHELKVVDGEAKIVEIEDVGSNYTIDIDGPEELDVNETGEFDVRAFGDGTGNINYTAIYEYEVTGGDGDLEYFDGDKWRTIPLEGQFGPEEGFELTPDWDVTTELRFTPYDERTYKVSIYLVDLDADNILAEDEYEVKVLGEEEPVDPVYIVDIDEVEGIEVDLGTTIEDVIDLLPDTTIITDSENKTHTVNLDWAIEDYNGEIAGVYDAVGTFELPEGIENTEELNLEVRTTVKVLEPADEDFPEEVESVTVGTSEITGNTYANINIKEEYVEDIESVQVDDEEANQIEDNPFQWRIKVEEGTTVDDLVGLVTVDRVEEPDPEPENPEITATYNPSNTIPTFGKVTVDVENIEDAAKFDVVYHLSNDENMNVKETDKVALGEESQLLFYDVNQYDTVTIRIYDADNSLLHTFDDVGLSSN